MNACGGGQEGASTPLGQTLSTEAAPSAQSIVLQKEGARRNTAELEAIAKTGVLPKPFEGPLLSGAAGSTKATLDPTPEPSAETKSLLESKSAASRTAVYRFFNSQTSAHFFTTSVTERNNVRATLPHMAYEGPAFYASGSAVPGLSPVHRFNNNQTGVHFYTISETERAHIAATMPQFVYEGIAYYASTLAGTGYTPLYRFFVSARGFHFYTSSQSERDNIIATLPQYSYEGVGYYVLGSDWQTPVIPHSGVTINHCYRAGSNTLESCESDEAMALNSQQDGHRASINPMSYSQVVSAYIGTFPFSIPLYFPRTDCVRDNVTGLIWEGKDLTGTRAGTLAYTNHADGRAGDASAYVNAVNALALCGFNDWRLPEAEELQSIVHFGLTSEPSINESWFPNTPASFYWTANDDAEDATKAWSVRFTNGTASTLIRSASFPFVMRVRLVRGQPWVGSRYLVTTAAYTGDSANNAVVDRKTGLTWRRCLQSQIWSGSACSGRAGQFNHESALANARRQTGWRMPNAREVGSLLERKLADRSLNPDAFPGAANEVLSASSPWISDSTYAWQAYGSDGRLTANERRFLYAVRLVLVEP
ncbi:hypothetical protein LPB72_09505 [Hydrogenophaga crassostreae]|uniref:DUF1566 domain-containing protein n=1 Tax=Hydrogenophaga crassostreae TaxID=1763535 RepID=A0A162P7H7_9BURK|nr:hypothetical protein LPB072_10900 [Hydrogenophaga crassostreae]OAD42107.1 hypothetical protein LPB72_09505 [Hydrogenophaga crassostreae]